MISTGSGLTVKNVYNALGYLSEVRNADTNALYWQSRNKGESRIKGRAE